MILTIGGSKAKRDKLFTANVNFKITIVMPSYNQGNFLVEMIFPITIKIIPI